MFQWVSSLCCMLKRQPLAQLIFSYRLLWDFTLYSYMAQIWPMVINGASFLTISSFSGPHSTVSRCPPNEYQCGGTELCIHMSKLCNGASDCTDGWDEGPHCRGITVTLSRTNVGLFQWQNDYVSMILRLVHHGCVLLGLLRRSHIWNNQTTLCVFTVKSCFLWCFSHNQVYVWHFISGDM